MFRTVLCVLLWVVAVLAGPEIQAQSTQPTAPASQRKVAFYVVAHQDDWQLFMGSNAYRDVQSYDKVVFVCLTAGQADKPGNAYWQGREYGCRAAAVAAVTRQMPAPTEVYNATTAVVNGHALSVFQFQNTETYSLRLPDGGLDAKGFARGGFQSLLQLRDGRGPMASIDGSATYATWADLVGTIRQLMLKEKTANTVLSVHCPDPDRKRNLYDHPDHTMAGVLALAASRPINCHQSLYLDYVVKEKKANLNTAQTANQSLLFATNCQGLVASGLETEWEPTHLCWLGRQYFRVRHNSTAPPTSQLVAALPTTTILVPTQVPGPMPTNGPNIPTTSTSSGIGDTTTQHTVWQTSTIVDQAGLILRPNYPNPFDASSLLSYQLPQAAQVTVRLFDLQGRLVRTVVEARQTPGTYELWLDVQQFPAAGVYVCQLQADRQVRMQRVQIIR